MSNVSPAGGRIPLVLLLLRLTIALVLVMWALDKFFKPDHTQQVFAAFYGLSSLGLPIIYGLGILQSLIILGFVAGFQKTWTYGAVLAMHGISTLVSFPRYLDPFNNLLFFAGWPMLAACFAVFYLRDLDTFWTLDRSHRATRINT
jgi:putative oxidoreductase